MKEKVQKVKVQKVQKVQKVHRVQRVVVSPLCGDEYEVCVMREGS